MSRYGFVFDETYNPMHEEIKSTVFKAINSYFDNPIFTKVKENKTHSIYMAKMDCLLTNEYRYIIATVTKNDNPINSTCDLAKLSWDSFQTRSIPDYYDIRPQRYTPKKSGDALSPINMSNRDEKQTTYGMEKYPLKITVLHKKEGKYEYPDRATLGASLETYQTIITFDF